jgi:lycopene cyclase domain-containing protein
MLTYAVLDIAVIAALAGLVLLRPLSLPWRRVALLCGVLLILTAVFDSLIIWAKLVAYNPQKILGWHIGQAPIEDFAYVLVAVILIPYLWKFYADKD